MPILELEGILTFIRRRQLSYPWVAALQRRILFSRLSMPIERAMRWPQLKALVRSTLQGAHRGPPADTLVMKRKRV